MKKIFKYIFSHPLLWVLCVVASVLSLMPFIFDGHYGCLRGTCGFIIGTNFRDGVWFLAVAETAFRSMPFRMPIFSGEILQGYHFLPNLISYLLSFLGIPITVTFYQIFPVLFMVGMILIGTKVAFQVYKDHKFVALFLFFLLFGIPLTAITSLYHTGKINNYALINTFQATRLLESIHFAFSFLILWGIVIILQKTVISWKNRIIIGILLFLVFGIKFYTAFLIVIILFISELIQLVKEKKWKNFLTNIIVYGLFSILSIFAFYNPLSQTSNGSVFIFSPFATVHHLIEEPSLFYLRDMVNARYYLYTQGWGPRLLGIELFSSFLFVLFYFGARILGFITIFYLLISRRITRVEIGMATASIIAITISVLFIQKGDWYNPMQFAVVAAYIMAYFTAYGFYLLLKLNRYLFSLIFIPIFIITFLPNLVNLGYLSNPSRYVISDSEMEALKYLKNSPDGSVLAPISKEDMAYVSAFTGKQTYVNFVNVLQNTGIKYEERVREIGNLTSEQAKNLPVKYVYIPETYSKHSSLSMTILESRAYKKIYSKNEVVIFKKLPGGN